MSEAGVFGILAGLMIAGGFVLTVLGFVLWLIDRRFDDPPDLMAGRRLMRVGALTLLAGTLFLVVVLLAT